MLPDLEQQTIKQQVPDNLRGCRLDQAAAKMFVDFSRGRLQAWIREGLLSVDGRSGKVRDKLVGGEWLTLQAQPLVVADWQAQPLDLNIVYEDGSILVVNKQAGLVVHPGAGNPDLTLLNGLLHHCRQLAEVPRAGIVHRLDKDTSGLLVVAKTLAAHNSLVKQLKARTVSRQYQAVIRGDINHSGTVDAPIGRHSVTRTRMAVKPEGKPAISHYRVIARYQGYCHVRVTLETGRTHQIRVHMAHIGHPLVGDPLYAGRLQIPKGLSETLVAGLRSFGRQALHAAHLGLIHPQSGESMLWQAPLPEDMQQLIALLESATADSSDQDNPR